MNVMGLTLYSMKGDFSGAGLLRPLKSLWLAFYEMPMAIKAVRYLYSLLNLMFAAFGNGRMFPFS